MPRILNSSSPAPKSRNSEAAAGSYHISRILLCYRTLRHSQAFLGISVSRAGAQNGWLNRNVFSQRGYTATLSLKAPEEDAPCLFLASGVTGRPWHPLAWSRTTPTSAPVLTWHPSSCLPSLCPKSPLLLKSLG